MMPQLKPPRADERSPPSSIVGNRDTPPSYLAAAARRSISQGPEMGMAALPELNTPVESHWPRLSTSREAYPLSIRLFQISSTWAAPSVLTLSAPPPDIWMTGRNWNVPSSPARAEKVMP